VPSLRERAGDIPLQAKYFVNRYAAASGKTIKSIQTTTLYLLQAYHWPGNVRELQNVIERALILCDSETLSIAERWIHRQTPNDVALSTRRLSTVKGKIEAALEHSRGRVFRPVRRRREAWNSQIHSGVKDPATANRQVFV
jgi:DNA-binding NtrC family response regulator